MIVILKFVHSHRLTYTTGGPNHHYCKGVQNGEVLQCLLFESTKPDAKLVAVEYFIEKNLARKNVSLIQWNRAFNDHEVEIAGGRVVILDPKDPEGQKAVAAAVGKIDGVIFHLWGERSGCSGWNCNNP